MFAKLKKKIQEETADSALGSPITSGISSPAKLDTGPTSPSLPTGSGYSSSSEEPNTTSKEDILKLLMKRTEQCKKLETKSLEYVAVIKDKNRSIEKLELSLEKHQDEMSKRMQDMNEQYQTNRVKLMDGFKKTLLDKEQEFINRINLIEEEKSDLEKKLHEKINQKDEENEEIQGFVTQETAKVKHMLLNTQEELAKCKESLEEKCCLIESFQKDSEGLQKELESLKSYLEQTSKERDKYEESNSAQTELVKKMTQEKSLLDSQLAELNSQLSQQNSLISQLESSKAELESKYVTLERNGDLSRNKTSKLLEEKSDHIDHLLERVKTLEERLQGQELSDDERVKALEKERDGVENKLSETRQQLMEVKSTWSDKISQLEEQVSHLNAKIVEDSEELSQKEVALADMQEKFQNKIDELKRKLEDAEARALENWELANQKDVQYEKEKHLMESLSENDRLASKKVEAELKAKVTSLETEVFSLQTIIDQERNISLTQIEGVEAKLHEAIERHQESEKRCRRLDEECNQLKERLLHTEGECNISNEELERKQGQITMLETRVSNIEKEKVDLESRLQGLTDSLTRRQSELSTSSNDKDELMLRNAELSQHLEKLRVSGVEEKRELLEELEQKSDAVVSLQKSLTEMEGKTAQLEDKVKTTQDAKNTADVKELESLEQTVACLEDQLAEKNKTIKVQQQRLTDLKKTLQRELKVQTLPNDVSIDSKDFASSPPTQRRTVTKNSAVTGPSNSPALLPINSSSSPSSNSSQYLQHLSEEHTNQFRESLQDDVNFEYLKHVVLKFMLSRESEALQLIKAVSVLLKFSSDEQKLIRETLEWKMSWFGARPPLGSGQKAKIIPPNY